MRAERNKKEADRAREHDFEVIDSAVTGTATAEPQDAALTSFALAVKSARPEPEAGFVVELNDRLARLRGSGDDGGHVSFWRRHRAQLIAVGCVAVLFGASMTVVNQGDGGDDAASRPQQAAGEPFSGQSQGGTYAADGGVKKLAAPESLGKYVESDTGSSVAEPISGRRDVIREASLRIGTGLEDFTDTTDEVVAITDRLGGFVRESKVSDGTADQPNGELLLMVPASKLQEALASISGLGTVLERNQNLSDVTASVSRTDRRVARLRAQRAAIAGRLADATTAEQKSVLRSQLRRADVKLSRAVAAQRSLQRQVRYSELSVDVEASAQRDQASVIGSAWETAKSALEAIVAVAIVAVAVGLPFALLVLLIVASARWARRRNRDRAVDSADSAPTQAP